MPPSPVVYEREGVGQNYRGRCASCRDLRLLDAGYHDGSTQFIHDLEDAHVSPWVSRGLPKLLPSRRWNGLGGFEKGGGFIEFEDVSRLEVKPVTDMNWNGDLTFRSKGSSHERICKR